MHKNRNVIGFLSSCLCVHLSLDSDGHCALVKVQHFRQRAHVDLVRAVLVSANKRTRRKSRPKTRVSNKKQTENTLALDDGVIGRSFEDGQPLVGFTLLDLLDNARDFAPVISAVKMERHSAETKRFESE